MIGRRRLSLKVRMEILKRREIRCSSYSRLKVTHLVFNKFFILFVSVSVLFSPAIYANEDTDVLPVKQQLHDSSVCSAAAQQAGTEYGVGFDLLQIIAVVESGKWDNLQNRFVAWPWTVNIKGKGHYFASKEEAIAAVKEAQAKGIKSIDVGCMQINMKYHGKAFSSIEDALDPLKNVQYSAKFLRTLYKSSGRDWKVAARRYHSRNLKEGQIYTKRLENRFETYRVAGLTRNMELF